MFIRAPEILRTWGRCSAIGTLQGRIVLAQQGRLVAAAFHPELSGDLRIYKWFLRLV